MKDDETAKLTIPTPFPNAVAFNGSIAGNIVGNYNTLTQNIYQAPSPTLGAPVLNAGQWSAKRIGSDDAALPYALEIVIQTAVDIDPVGFAIECSGPIGKMYIANHMPVLMNSFVGVVDAKKHPNVGTVQYTFPKLTPREPLVLHILSKGDIIPTQVNRIIG